MGYVFVPNLKWPNYPAAVALHNWPLSSCNVESWKKFQFDEISFWYNFFWPNYSSLTFTQICFSQRNIFKIFFWNEIFSRKIDYRWNFHLSDFAVWSKFHLARTQFHLSSYEQVTILLTYVLGGTHIINSTSIKNTPRGLQKLVGTVWRNEPFNQPLISFMSKIGPYFSRPVVLGGTQILIWSI